MADPLEGYGDYALRHRLGAAETAYRVTNMDLARERMRREAEMQPLEMDLKRAQVDESRTRAAKIAEEVQKQRVIQDLLPRLGPNPDPAVLRQIGNRLQYEPFIKEADRLEAAQNSRQGIATMAGSPAQTVEGPTEAPNQMGPGPGVEMPGRAGVLDDLFDSPYVGKQAKALAMLGQQGAPGLTAQNYAMFVKNLQDKHIAETGKAQAREENAGNRIDYRNMFPPQQRQPMTRPDENGYLLERGDNGRWSNAIDQSGNPIKAGTAGMLSSQNQDERRRRTEYVRSIAEPERQLRSFEQYEQAKETWRKGDKVPQAYVAAAQQLIQMSRGNAKFKGDLDQALGGGNIAQRVWGSLSRVATGEPSGEQLQDLDTIMNALALASARNIGMVTRNAYSDAKAGRINTNKVIGAPRVYGSFLILPTGETKRLKSNNAALKAANLWTQENQGE